jgi:PAS domain S-box-containing protein
MPGTIHVVLLDDQPEEVCAQLTALHNDGREICLHVATTKEAYTAALSDVVDIVLASSTCAALDARHALRLLHARALPVPFLVITEPDSEQLALECLQQGAEDYVFRDRLARLGPAILRALGRTSAVELEYPTKQQHTHELVALNERLRKEIGERMHIEASLRASEERYRLLAEYATDVILRITLEGIVLYVSPACRQVFGYEPHELVGQSVYPFLAPEEQADVRAMHTHLLKTGDQISVVHRYYHKSGQYIWLETSARLMHDPQTGEMQIVAIARDVTARKRMEDEIQRLNADLQRQVCDLESSNRELEAFSYSVSHDLRTPLRVIDGFSQIILENALPLLSKDIVYYLERIQHNAQRMQQLIDELLQLSRFARQPLMRQTVSMTEIVCQAYNNVCQHLHERHVQFEVDDLPPCQGDPNLLRQVYENLLGNAIKFTRTREVAHIHAGYQTTNGQIVYFVRDNGVGFDMSDADRLFVVFQRLHSSDEYEGTGVGLSIVQRIIYRHGGHIWAQSSLGEGTTFYFTCGSKPQTED